MQRDKIQIEAFYSDDTPAAGARIEVYRDKVEGKPMLTGKTDSTGICMIPRPEPGKYVVVIDAGAGHRKPLAMVVPPLKVLSVTFALGMPALGSFDNLGIVPVLAQDWRVSAAPVGESPAMGPGGPIISKGPTRQQFTEYPWRKMMTGVMLIVLGTVVLMALRRRTRAM